MQDEQRRTPEQGKIELLSQWMLDVSWLFASLPGFSPPSLCANALLWKRRRLRSERMRVSRWRRGEERRPMMGPRTKVLFWPSSAHIISHSSFWHLSHQGAALLLGSFDSPFVLRTLSLRGEEVPARHRRDTEMASLVRGAHPWSRRGFWTHQREGRPSHSWICWPETKNQKNRRLCSTEKGWRRRHSQETAWFLSGGYSTNLSTNKEVADWGPRWVWEQKIFIQCIVFGGCANFQRSTGL